MQPEVSKGDIVNLAPYQFFAKTSGDVSEDAFTGRTVPVNAQSSAKVADDVRERSQRRYGTPRKVVEDYIDSLFMDGPPAPRTKTKPAEGQPRADDAGDEPVTPEQLEMLKGRDLEA
jgi:hypothetical protein